MEKSVMKQSHKGFAPFNSPDKSNKTMPKVFKKAAHHTEYKKPTAAKGKQMAGQFSGRTAPEAQSGRDKKQYTKASQPIQYSNVGVKPTKFIS